MREKPSGWERVREALRRDWEQTRHDLHVGGHELNQGVKDTLRQIAGRQTLPPIDRPNPPRILGSFAEAEGPMRFGWSAQHDEVEDRFSLIEPQLRQQWEASPHGRSSRWDDVRELVRRGFEHREDRPTRRPT